VKDLGLDKQPILTRINDFPNETFTDLLGEWVREPDHLLSSGHMYKSPEECFDAKWMTMVVGDLAFLQADVMRDKESNESLNEKYSIPICKNDYLHSADQQHWLSFTYVRRMISTAQCLRLCKTMNGALAQVPYGSEAGDVIAVFRGAAVPFVLRPFRASYRVVGPCYVHGAMNGEFEHLLSGSAIEQLVLI